MDEVAIRRRLDLSRRRPRPVYTGSLATSARSRAAVSRKLHPKKLAQTIRFLHAGTILIFEMKCYNIALTGLGVQLLPLNHEKILMPLRYRWKKPSVSTAGAKVLDWAKEPLCDDENSAVSLSTNVCDHAACGGEETIILFMRRGERTLAFRIAKPVDTVTQAEVAEALQPILPVNPLDRVR